MKLIALIALAAASIFAQVPPATFSGPTLTLPQMSYSLNGKLYQTNASIGQSYSATVDVTSATYPTNQGQLEVLISPSGYEVLPLVQSTGFVTAGYTTLLTASDPSATPLYVCTFRQASGPTAAAWTGCSTPIVLAIASPNSGFFFTSPVVLGRYVRISGPQFLALAEVVVTPPNSSTDIALHQPASQSSTLPPTGGITPVAALGVDGNTDGNFFDGSVTSTAGTEAGWWQVDLGIPSAIGTITIWNRTDCCGSRLSNFTISISNNSDGSSPVWSYLVSTAPNPSSFFVLTTLGTPTNQ